MSVILVVGSDCVCRQLQNQLWLPGDDPAAGSMASADWRTQVTFAVLLLLFMLHNILAIMVSSCSSFFTATLNSGLPNLSRMWPNSSQLRCDAIVRLLNNKHCNSVHDVCVEPCLLECS